LDDFVDKGWPVVRPLLLKDRDEDEVQLVEESLLGSKRFFRAGALDDELDNEVADSYPVSAPYMSSSTLMEKLTLTLVSWQNLPSRHDDIVEHLQTQIFGGNVSGGLFVRLHRGEQDQHFVWGYCASDRILSTSSQASGSSLNYSKRSGQSCS
jgi:hypothetical protein